MRHKGYAVCVGLAVAARSLPVRLHGESACALYGYNTVVINGRNTAPRNAPMNRTASGTTHSCQAEGVPVVEVGRLIGNDGQGVLAGRYDFKGSSCRRGELIVAAWLVCDGDGVLANRNSSGRKLHSVFTLRNNTLSIIPDHHGGGLLRTVILERAWHTQDGGCTRVLGDGHIIQLSRCAVLVVAVTGNHLIPDRVAAGVRPLGDVEAVAAAAVYGIREISALRCAAALQQSLRTSSVDQIPSLCRVCCHLRVRLGDGSRHGGGVADVVLFADILRNRHAVNDNGLVCSDLLVREVARCCDIGNGIPGDQAAADGNSQYGGAITIVDLIRRCHNCSNRLGLGEEGPGVGSCFVAVTCGLGGCDGDAAGLLDGHCAGVFGNTGNIFITAAPRHLAAAGAAGRAKIQCIAVVDRILLAGDGQRNLVRTDNLKCGLSREAVVGPLACDGDFAHPYIGVVTVADRVLAGRNHVTLIIGNGNGGLVLASGVVEAVGEQRDSQVARAQGVHFNLRSDDFDIAVLMCGIALHLGVNCVSAHIGSGGYLGGIGYSIR